MANTLGSAAQGAAAGAAAGSVVPGIGTAIGGAIGAAGGILGSLASSADRERAQNLLKEAYELINQTGAPPELAKEIILDKFTQAGLYTPQLEQAIEQHASELGSLQEDPAMREAGVNALNKLRGVADVGITATERAAMHDVRRQAARDDASRRASIMQDMQARGQSGSGAELAAQLASAQTATENEAAQADRVAAEANQRALAALSQYGDMSTRMRGQDFDINSAKARANDELNRFNVMSQQNVQQRNVANINNANKSNLLEKQRIQDMNTMQTNTERLRQNQAKEQDWLNKLKLNQLKAGATKEQAGNAMDQAQNTANTVGGVAQGIGQVASGMYQYYNRPGSGNTGSGGTQDADLTDAELLARRKQRGF